jgi:hypothetical protein
VLKGDGSIGEQGSMHITSSFAVRILHAKSWAKSVRAWVSLSSFNFPGDLALDYCFYG